MAVTGTFLADFDSFYAAVKKADIELAGLDTGAGTVATKLNNVANAFSGKKIIQDATIAAQAVAEIGGATVLTEKEQARLNATLTEALAKYKALGQEAPADMVALAEATKKVTAEAPTGAVKVFNDLGASVKSTMLGMVSAQAIIGGVQSAFQGLTDFIGGSITSYAGAEAAAKKMTVALKNQGTATPQTIAGMNDLAAQMQATTVYSDDLTNNMEALFIQIGGVGPGQMDKAMTAAADLASGLGVDLETAVTLVSKAAEGNTGALKKYGIAIDDAKVAAEGLPAVLEAINARFGGQAQAEAETYAGKVKQLANEWDNLKEAVGRMIVEDAQLQSDLTLITKLITGVGTAAAESQPTISEWWAILTNDPQQILYQKQLRAAKALTQELREELEKLGGVPITPPEFKAPPSIKALTAGLMREAADTSAALIKTWNDEDAAAKKHAEAIKAMFDRLSGANAAATMADLDTVFRRMAASGKITEAQVRAIAKEATALSAQGATLTPRLLDIVLATDQLSPGLNTTALNFRELGEQVSIVAPKLDKVWEQLNKPIPYGISHLKDQFAALVVVTPETMLKGVTKETINTDKAIKELSTSLSNLATIAPGSFGSLIGQVAKFAGAVDVASSGMKAFKEGKKAFDAGESIAGIASMASGIAGIAQAAMMAVQGVKALISVFDRNKGRDAVVAFAESFGGFDALHAQLLELGADGEKLWVQLTQGVGTNNPAQAARVISEVEAALKKQADAQQDVTTTTEDQALATIETATQASAALDTVTAKLTSNAADWQAWGASVTAYIADVAAAVKSIVIPSPTGALPFGAGGGGAGGGGTAILQLDGRTVAEAVVPAMPGVITRYGLARG